MPSPGYIPGPLVIPLTFQIRLLWFMPNGRTSTNVLHAIVPDGFTNSEGFINALYEGIIADPATAPYFTQLASTTALTGLDARDLRVASQGLIASSDSATPGTGVGNPLPEEVSLVVTLRSELAGRAHRGRVFLSGFDESVLDAQGHATGTLTLLAQEFMVAIGNTFNALGITLGIAHRGHAEYVNHLGQTVAAEAPGTDRVISHLVRDNIFDSQRRRK